MKRKQFLISTCLCAFLGMVSLVGCGGGGNVPPKDYNADVQAVETTQITMEHFVAEEGVTYYTSEGLELWMSVNGEYLRMDYFSLDGKKRVYDNLYFYKDDYFVMATDDLTGWFCALSDTVDDEYAETERQDGEDIQVNVKKSGIYKLVFDTETLKFDMQYKAEIQMPVYYTIKNCSIYSVATNWVEMTVNPENADEFMIENYSVVKGKGISFFNNIHTSNYKVTLDEGTDGKYATARKTAVTVNIGGVYNVYINAKTYVVRMQLVNPDTADYGCIYYDGTDFIELQPYETDVPYVFRYSITVDVYESMPSFYSTAYKEYVFTPIRNEWLMVNGTHAYFKQVGKYDVVINLKTFEITAELLPE
ncbi:MAG: hypothetical protein IJ996_03100 [Clostridia bacterium]|nr:hypothetical protein [Clostridia bacterium]